jgi:hypothetical protein
VRRANDGLIVSERISIHRATTKQRYQSVVCRFLDAFDKDVGGVTAVQHALPAGAI